MNTDTDKETPNYGEPWAIDGTDGFLNKVVDAKGSTVAGVRPTRRAVQCVNACAGMADPAAEIAELRRERDELKAWKESALAVESEWDVQELAKMLGAKPGQSCRRVIHERVPELLASHAEMCARLQECVQKHQIGLDAGHWALAKLQPFIK